MSTDQGGDAGESSSDMSPVDRRPGGDTRVAVDVLHRDQQAVLFYGDPDRDPPVTPIDAGFESQRELLNWWQAACVRSFGHLDEIYPAVQIRRDQALTEALTTSDPTPGQQRQRTRIREHVLAACTTAYRDLEERAHEWLPGDEGPDGGKSDYRRIDPDSQQHIAMRPAFSRLDTGQARILRRLWGGFEDRNAIVRWGHRLPAVADFSGILEDETTVTEWLVTDRAARTKLLDQSEDGRAWRERFAAAILLPAFAVRAKRLQGGALERSKRDPDPFNEGRTHE